jgi:hypothetical protein
MDILIYILFSGICTFYLVFLTFRKKIHLNDKVFNISKNVHYLTFGLIIFNFIIYWFDFKLRGIWTFKIIMWIYLLYSFVVQFKIDYLKSRVEKNYFKILLYSPSVLAFSWLVPMLGAYLCYSFMLLFNTYYDKVL